jgi:hypothetical protein
MRLRDQDLPLDPDVERELAAVDAGLVGLDVAPDLEDLAELASNVRADAPAPQSDFAATLDEWAAAGFPRDGRLRSGGEGERGSAPGGLRERLQSVPPRRLLLSAGAAATFLVAAAVGIGVSAQLGGSSQAGPSVQALPGPADESSRAGAGNPSTGSAPQTSDSVRAGRGSAPSNVPFTNQLRLQDAAPNLHPTPEAIGSVAAGGPRKVAQNADLVLSAEPQDVRDVADGVVGVVDKYNGYVVSSNVTSGRVPAPTPVPEQGDRAARGQQGSGTFKLKIPAQHLQDALGDMSKLAHVSSRTEGVQDITRRFDAAKGQVHDLNVERGHLLRRLGNAVTLTEEESLKARLQVVENQLASARDQLGHVQKRIQLVPVTVEIQGQAGVDAGGGGNWSIGDAFHDAGRVLTVIAGILLISAAVLAPLGLIGALAWITARAVIRRRREDALE